MKKKKKGKYVGLVRTRESVTIYPEWSETRADQPRVLQWLGLTPQQVRNETILKWYYDQKSPYLFFLHFESMIYNYLPCQILGHDFNEKSEFLDFELSIKLPAITKLKNGRVQKRVGSREDMTSSNQDI